MTGFILNGLSESLLSSRLFRIKAWVLQVPFLSMIFLYFFDYSNLNHSKVFYCFLYLLYPYYVLLLCRLLPVQNFYLFLFGLSLYKFTCLFCASLNIFLYKHVSFLLQFCLKKDTTSVSLALFRAHFYFCLTFLLSPFLFFDIMRISRGVDSHTIKKALSSKVLILKEKSRGCYWT